MSIPSESFRILIVDDDRLSRQILCRSLLQERYQVIEASNGAECLSIYAEAQPHLVLLDAMMPEMNGFECCMRLRKLPDAANTPIIMVTGLEDKASVDWAFDAGATDYVTKPIHWPILRRRVKNLLEKGYFYQELEVANQRLQEHAITDSLTGLLNRRYFDECFNREWARSIRDHKKLSLILCDIDYFKLYNDTYGHQAGDVCLTQVAQTLKEKAAKRATDVVARYGGEEFVAILPSTGISGAHEVANQLKEGIKALQIPHAGAADSYGQITISQGIASTIADRNLLPADLINCADKALYYAKRNGRNAIGIYQDGQVFTELAQLKLQAF